MLRATTACNFPSHLASWLRTRRFSEPTFRPPRAINHWKTQCFATFLPFRAPGSSFFFLLSPFFFSSFFFSSSFYLLPSSFFLLLFSSFFSSLPSSLLFLLLFSSLLFSSLLLLSSPLLSSALLFSSRLFSSLLSLLFSSLTLLMSALHLSILSEVWLLNFLRSAHLLDFILTLRQRGPTPPVPSRAIVSRGQTPWCCLWKVGPFSSYLWFGTYLFSDGSAPFHLSSNLHLWLERAKDPSLDWWKPLQNWHQTKVHESHFVEHCWHVYQIHR